MIVGVVDNNEAISFSAGFLGLHIVVVDPMTRFMERLEVQGGIDEVNRGIICVHHGHCLTIRNRSAHT